MSDHLAPNGLPLLPYRPITPNAHWLEGEEARIAGQPRAGSVRHAYAGHRWEWEAGWDYADALRFNCSDCGHLRANHGSGGRCWVPACDCGRTTEDEA